MKEEIKEYLDKKIYSAKKGVIALALCGATTLALTGCGESPADKAERIRYEQQLLIEPNLYRLYIEKNDNNFGYHDFNVKYTEESTFQGSSYSRYYTIDNYEIEFCNGNCKLIKDNELIATYTDAYIEKIDLDIEWTPIENEKATNLLEYETKQMENPIDLEN